MNNQFDPNNMNSWQQQQQNLQRMQQQFKQQNTTSSGTRFGIAFLFGFLPQLFLSIFGHDTLEYGILWIIGISIIIIAGLITFIITKVSSEIKTDVVIPVTSMSAAMLSFTVFLNIPSQISDGGPGILMYFVAIFMAFVFYFVAAIITWVILFFAMMSKMKKQFMSGENPFQKMMNPNMMNQNMNQNQNMKTTKRPQTKKELDEDLKKQGIDVDQLDSEFGTHFEPEEAQDVKGKNKPTEENEKDKK